MDVVWTILIILGALLAAPLVVLGHLIFIFAAILGFIFLMIVMMMGIEPSKPVLITCMVAGLVVVIATGIGRELENKKNEKGFRSKSDSESTSLARSTSNRVENLPDGDKWREALDKLRSDKDKFPDHNPSRLFAPAILLLVFFLIVAYAL